MPGILELGSCMHTFMATGDNAQARLVESWWGRITMVGLTTLDVELAPLERDGRRDCLWWFVMKCGLVGSGRLTAAGL